MTTFNLGCEPIYLPVPYSAATFWGCTCGEVSTSRLGSKAQALLDYELGHRHPDAAGWPGYTRHKMYMKESTFQPLDGGPAPMSWRCLCGADDPAPAGHTDERRLRQSFSRHQSAQTVKWVQAQHRAEVQALTPEQKEQHQQAISKAREYLKHTDQRRREAQRANRLAAATETDTDALLAELL